MSAPTASDEAAIARLIDEMTQAWNRGDAKAYGAHYRDDATFTNVNGTFHIGRAAFDRRHEEVFSDIFNGTTQAMTIKKLRFIAADVAVVDVDTSIAGCRATALPFHADGKLYSCLMMVMIKQDGTWWISAYHNVWRTPASTTA
jgi:uncharacterized protein (TIGR02246 family)